MSKKEKVIMAVFVPLTIIMVVLYVLTSEYTRNVAVEAIYPEGKLSDSLFVSQNTTYVENSALPKRYSFSQVPYTVDIPEGKKAYVGNGCIIQATSSLYIYVTEYEKDQDGEAVMLEEFPTALLIDYDPLYTYTQKFQDETGYINGFSAQYKFSMLSVSNGSVAKNGYIASYSIFDPYENDGGNVFIGVVTTGSKNEDFNNAKAILDAIMQTMRYDQKLDKQIQREQAAQLKTEATPTPALQEKEESNPDDPYDFTVLIEDSDIDARFIPFTLDHTYGDMFINCKYDAVVNGSEMTLYSPQKEEVGIKVVSEDGLTTQFQLGRITEDMLGVYAIKITHYAKYSGLSLEVGDAADSQNITSQEENEEDGISEEAVEPAG